MQKYRIPVSTIKTIQNLLEVLEAKAERSGVPPKSAQAAARRGLELRREFGRGGTMVGVSRARDIQNGKNLSERTVRRMKAFFDRHEVDKRGKDWDNAERPSNGKIAHLLWGGDAGRTWATNLVERWNREDGKTKSIPRWLPNGEEITELNQLAAVLCIDEKTAAFVVLDSHEPPKALHQKAVRRVSNPDNDPTEQEILDEDGDWTGRTGTRHYSLGRVLKPQEEKRSVRDSDYWGAPVGTPLPLPSGFRRSTPKSRISKGIGTHGVIRAADARERYRSSKGLEGSLIDYRKVAADKPRAGRIADAYDELPIDDPKAHKAYDKLAEEIDEQYLFLTEDLKVNIEFVDEDPYKNSQEMMDDVESNNRLKVLSTATTGPHPYLTDEQNDKFRAVHDYFGHAATGRGFAQDGEEAAWVSHSQMFTMEARSALTTETRGQNSWYNTRQQGFATQKVALLPSEFWDISKDDVPLLRGKEQTAGDLLEDAMERGKVEPDSSKDVYAGDRSGGVSGGVAAPFEILKPVRRKKRVRLRRIMNDRKVPQRRRLDSEG